MPNGSDVRPTSHDRHDPLLVAALAAGDLAGTDRAHANELIESCADCATLHDDLVAIARATATVPPPIATRPRDFRLTPEQARGLRPSGWRRVIGAFAGPRLAFAKPLGIGLTTIGLAGLLLGNINLSIGMGGAASASAPSSASGAANGGTSESNESYPRAVGDASVGTDGAPAASGGFGPVTAPAGSAPAASSAPAALPSSDQVRASDGSALSAAGGKTESPGASQPSREAFSTPVRPTQLPASPDTRTMIFVAAVLVGLGLLVVRRVARRVAAA